MSYINPIEDANPEAVRLHGHESRNVHISESPADIAMPAEDVGEVEPVEVDVASE